MSVVNSVNHHLIPNSAVVTENGMHDLKLPLLSIGVTLNHASVICSGLGSLECFVVIKCTKFGQLILRKIIKIVATRCQILRLKCPKFDFG